jgi:hypothetical protein
MPMGYEQFQPSSRNLNAKKIKKENDHSQNITPQQPNLQHVQISPMPMGISLGVQSEILFLVSKLLSRTCRHRFFMGRVLLSLCHGTL